jgi:nucleotide-binding universal stress UspA family protein
MFTKILVATDGSSHGTKAVNIAASMALKFDASLVIGHVLLHGEPPSAFRRMAEVEHLVRAPSVPKPNEKNIPGGMISLISQAEQSRVSRDVIDALAGRITDHAVSIAKKIGVKNVTAEIAEGDTANRILLMAENVGADLIVIGTRGFGPLRALLMGSTSQKVTQLANCACLTIKG